MALCTSCGERWPRSAGVMCLDVDVMAQLLVQVLALRLILLRAIVWMYKIVIVVSNLWEDNWAIVAMASC